MALNRVFSLVFCAVIILAAPSFAQNADKALQRFDKDGDDRVSKKEWKQSGKSMRGFKKLDANSDGYVTREEFATLFGGGPKQEKATKPVMSSSQSMPKGDYQPSTGNDVIDKEAIDKETLCAISRSKKCSLDPAIKRGLFVTGLEPKFPDHLNCRGIDEFYAKDYTAVRNRTQLHGGIDMPVPWYTPMRFMADGEVVGNYEGFDSYRGREVIVRHSPEDTGIPLWIYSQYAHCDEQPKQQVGQRVKMGDIVCRTGNTGRGKNEVIQSSKRRPAIHFAIWYSKSPRYFPGKGKIIMENGHWMDPNAIFRKQLPLDSYSMRDLPEAEKKIPISVMVEDGELIPAATKLIWPYTCTRK